MKRVQGPLRPLLPPRVVSFLHILTIAIVWHVLTQTSTIILPPAQTAAAATTKKAPAPESKTKECEWGGVYIFSRDFVGTQSDTVTDQRYVQCSKKELAFNEAIGNDGRVSGKPSSFTPSAMQSVPMTFNGKKPQTITVSNICAEKTDAYYPQLTADLKKTFFFYTKKQGGTTKYGPGRFLTKTGTEPLQQTACGMIACVSVLQDPVKNEFRVDCEPCFTSTYPESILPKNTQCDGTIESIKEKAAEEAKRRATTPIPFFSGQEAQPSPANTGPSTQNTANTHYFPDMDTFNDYLSGLPDIDKPIPVFDSSFGDPKNAPAVETMLGEGQNMAGKYISPEVMESLSPETRGRLNALEGNAYHLVPTDIYNPNSGIRIETPKDPNKPSSFSFIPGTDESEARLRGSQVTGFQKPNSGTTGLGMVEDYEAQRAKIRGDIGAMAGQLHIPVGEETARQLNMDLPKPDTGVILDPNAQIPPPFAKPGELSSDPRLRAIQEQSGALHNSSGAFMQCIAGGKKASECKQTTQ